MAFRADLHIHSRYAMATSRNLNPETMVFRARRKGITVLGTGDFTHPGWLRELKEKLTPDGTGLSSSPQMNRLCEFLDPFTLICMPVSPARVGTVDLYPQAGKYFHDGHRKCGIRLNPDQTGLRNTICPACHRPVTTGVLNRVRALAGSRTESEISELCHVVGAGFGAGYPVGCSDPGDPVPD